MTQEPVVTKQLETTSSGEAGLFKVQLCKFPPHVIFDWIKAISRGLPLTQVIMLPHCIWSVPTDGWKLQVEVVTLTYLTYI